jgi:hypothetical protein
VVIPVKRGFGVCIGAFVFLSSVRLSEAVSVPEDWSVSLSTYAAEVPGPAMAPYEWRTVLNAAFLKDENLSYVVKWGVITAGYSTLAVKGTDVINGRPAYHIYSEAQSGGVVSPFYKVQDHNESWLDQTALVSVRYEKRINEGHYRIEETTTIDQPHQRFHLQSFRFDKNIYEEKSGDLPPNILDVLGSLYYVRLLPLEVGKSYTMDALSGDKVYPLEVIVKKRERIKVPAGTFETFRVEPFLRAPGIFVAKGKKLEVWLTADDHHTPVRMRSEIFIGHVSAELVPAKNNVLNELNLEK